MKRLTAAMLMCSVLFLQGCAVCAASSLGYMEAKPKYSKLYDAYKLEAENTNIEREKNGEPAEPVKEFKEWLKEQPLKSYEIKVFKNFGVISAQDAKDIKERQALERQE